jgi:hypothetical protein
MELEDLADKLARELLKKFGGGNMGWQDVAAFAVGYLYSALETEAKEAHVYRAHDHAKRPPSP